MVDTPHLRVSDREPVVEIQVGGVAIHRVATKKIEHTDNGGSIPTKVGEIL